MKRILICTDGEDHSLKAEEHAVFLASSISASLTGLYVQSTFLHKFVHEIYAVGRNECKDHLDRSLFNEGMRALEALERRCLSQGIPLKTKVRKGDIASEILAEVAEFEYDLLIMGAKLLSSWRDKLESANVSLDIFKQSPIPVLFVR